MSTPSGRRKALAGGRTRRLPVLLLVVAVAAAGTVADHVAARRPPPAAVQAAAVVSQVAPAGAQSASWFCTGASGPANPVAQPTLLLVSTVGHRVRGVLHVVDDHGSSASKGLSVPPWGEVTARPGALLGGKWLSATVDLAGGGVAVSQVVQGPAGWAAGPCASESATNWYFATGATTTGDTMAISVYNPGTSLAVVDLSFVTSAGLSQPQADQGVVVQPGATTTVDVGTYVQNQAAVATEVIARSGSVVAAELQVSGASGVSGLSLRLGAPVLARQWSVPRAYDPIGGSSQLVVFNPAAVAQRVAVRVRLESGPVAPFVHVVGPSSVWILPTSQQIRIPAATDYAATVDATGGPGVVVERTQASAATAPVPQWGAVGAIGAGVPVASRRWVVPALGAAGIPGAPGTLTVSAVNPSAERAVHLRISAITPAGLRTVSGALPLRLAPHGYGGLSVGSLPVLVVADGPVAIYGDQSPAAGPGQIAYPAVPLG